MVGWFILFNATFNNISVISGLDEQVPFTYRLKLYALFINGKMRLAFIDSKLLYRGAL
jgi:hypothetical protein